MAIGDLFPEVWYLDCVNRAYGLALTLDNLSEDGSALIAKRLEIALKQRYGRRLIKKDVLVEMLREFASWATIEELPQGTAANAERLFGKITAAFGVGP